MTQTQNQRQAETFAIDIRRLIDTSANLGELDAKWNDVHAKLQEIFPVIEDMRTAETEAKRPLSDD